MNLIDAVCSHPGCSQPIRWLNDRPRLCAVHGGVTYTERHSTIIQFPRPTYLAGISLDDLELVIDSGDVKVSYD